MKKKITWVTADYFVDCDFNPGILKELLKEFEIHWIILLPTRNARFKESDFRPFHNFSGLTIEFYYSKYRQRDPRRALYYLGILKRINRLNPDLIYLNCVPDPYFIPFFWLLNKSKTIICAHDGGTHSGFEYRFLTALSFKWTFGFAKHVCMFSKHQAKLFQENFKKAQITIIPLALKSFGVASAAKSNRVRFLSFGNINSSKSVDLLIDAACNIYEEGYDDFKVAISGQCSDWNFYQSRMKYPELFDCDIRLIENAEIPNIFNSAHYFVQPYRHVSQSGAMKVAFQYNIPVIASDFPGFRDEIKEGVNGFLFEPNNVQDLQKTLKEVLDNHDQLYPQLTERMSHHTREHYSETILASQYKAMFKKLLVSEK